MDKIMNTLSKFIVFGFGVLGGAFFGAIVSYFFFGIIYLAVFGNGPVMNSDECARGSALGWLSIFGGGLLGAILGCYGALNIMKAYEVEDEGSAREKSSNSVLI